MIQPGFEPRSPRLQIQRVEFLYCDLKVRGKHRTDRGVQLVRRPTLAPESEPVLSMDFRMTLGLTNQKEHPAENTYWA